MSESISARSRRRSSERIMAMQGARTVRRPLQRPPCEGRGRAREGASEGPLFNKSATSPLREGHLRNRAYLGRPVAGGGI